MPEKEFSYGSVAAATAAALGLMAGVKFVISGASGAQLAQDH
jgi:hypothetical protein